jgi:hypothetical protein
MHSSSQTSERWSWPADRAIVLYHWRWYDPELGEVVSGWSQQCEADHAGYVHFEADALYEAHTRHIDPQRRRLVVVEPYTFTSVTSLPPLLVHDSGPQTWICALLTPTLDTGPCHRVAQTCPQ